MKDIGKIKIIYKILIFVGCIASFAFAYFIYASRYFDVSSPDMAFIGIATVGLAFYLGFELINILMYNLCKRFINGFVLSGADFKYTFRLAVTFRNICLGLCNLLFINFPIISVWGILIAYVVFTTLMLVCVYLLFKKHYEKEAKSAIYLNKIIGFYSLFLIVYLIFGSVL